MKAARILVATLNVATAVSAGERTGSDRYAAPKDLSVAGMKRPETVNEAVSAGVLLLSDWAAHESGGSSEWFEKLQGWLEDWKSAFRRSDAGDEAAGFQRLVELLGSMTPTVSLLETGRTNERNQAAPLRR
jgi:hypothetical protein